jgi:transcriptional regulator with XRE-family HTH domain
MSNQPRELIRTAYWKKAGQLLRLLRERNGWSYFELAERAGVTADLVVAYEQARVRFPEVEACWRLTKALGVSLATFLDQAEKQSGASLVHDVKLATFTAATVTDDERATPADQDQLSSFVSRLQDTPRKEPG